MTPWTIGLRDRQRAFYARKRRDRLLFVAAVFALLGAVVAGVAWNLARAWGS